LIYECIKLTEFLVDARYSTWKIVLLDTRH